MMKNWKELEELIEKHNGTYINHENLMFKCYAPGHLMVSARWPDYEGEEDLSLVYLCNDPERFYEKLEIENIAQIDQIQPHLLLKLFNSDSAMVVCGNGDDDESLEFEIVDGQLTARSGESGLEHQVNEKLETPDDFVKYTKQYFLLTKGEYSKN